MPLRTPIATGLVAAGGAAGAAARWGLVRAAPVSDGAFPATTLLVNAVGAGLLGYLVGRVPVRGGRSEGVRLLLGTGLLGGFTTFSTVALELWRTPNVLYAVAALAGGVAAAVVGLAAGSMAARD